MTKISQLSSIGDSLAIGDQFLIRDIDDAGSPNKSVTVSGITRALADGDATAPALAFAADKNTGIYRAGTDSLAVATNGTGRLFIDASGRLLVGTSSSSADTFFRVQGKQSSSASNGVVQIARGQTNPSSDNGLGHIQFTDAAGSIGASIIAETELNWGASDYPSRLIFSTTADNASSPTERLRITSAGRVGIGTSAPQLKLDVATTGTYGVSYQPAVNLRNTSSGGTSSNPTGLGAINWNVDGLYDVANIEAVRVDPSNGTLSDLVFRTNPTNVGTGAGTERLRITYAGRVGIGTTSPGQALEVLGTIYSQNNATSIVHFQAADTGAATDEKTWRIAQSQRAAKSIQLGVALNDASSVANAAITIVRSGATLDNIQFATGSGSERARIDSTGKLLLGTSTSRTIASSGENTRLQIESPNSTIAGFSIITNRGDNLGPVIYLGKSRGPSNGGTTIVADGDILGEIRFAGTDGTDIESMGARIIASVDGTPGVDDMPGKIAFLTSADGSASPTERLRITSTGQVRLAGAGITFNGDTAAANELDDYEEGTFTPTIEGTTTAGTATYTRQAGVYTKVGRQVFYAIDVIYASGTGTGNLRIAGLPFTSSSTSMIKTGAIFADDIALTAGNYPGVTLSLSSTVLLIKQLPTGGGASSSVPYDAAGQFTLTGHYFV